MYPDAFFDLLNRGFYSWVALAFFYAGFVYCYNLTMCMITGGLSQLQRFNKKVKKSIKLFASRKYWSISKKHFLRGGRHRIAEFRSDKLSWSWPLTVLAMPTMIYGISRTIILQAYESLADIGINASNYMPSVPDARFQYYVWFIALLISMSTFFRYHRYRSKPTWFSRSRIFNLSLVLFFDFPLAYMVLSTGFMWLQYSITLFRVLSDQYIVYPVFHPDQMYGLRVTYEAVLTMMIFLTLLSFLPAVMLVREKYEKYSKIYYFMIYGALVTLFVVLGALVYEFDQRLNAIQVSALNVQIISDLNDINMLNNEKLVGVLYFFVVTSLPAHFPVPSWLEILLSSRLFVFVLEVLRIIAPGSTQSLLARLLNYLA